jgi:hypothetical protein
LSRNKNCSLKKFRVTCCFYYGFVAQRAATAAELVPVFAEEARRRQIAAGKHGAEGGRGHKKVKPLAKNYRRVKASQQNRQLGSLEAFRSGTLRLFFPWKRKSRAY